ncbi:hypothetical protein O7599_18785 [Streptomyces sp. WMMC500]|uniref:hypothetical protein n=1 Tax=Streptomyces sp. WMMC500 TaxID=3015154 RepID=UPI00248C6B66|nr:hypothetical protein [Streptomyces sp. WMMC500]WBB57733.1 hypothetical protein O7599_18785 [Streptomyces sp. WMMC500]
MPDGSASPSTAEEYARAARTEHDRAWPGIAEKCRGLPTEATPEPSKTPADDIGPPPENPKWAENHAFKQTFPVSPDEQCRGDVHAARIGAGLKAAAPADLKDARRTRHVLEDLGYDGSVYAKPAGPGAVAWDVTVTGTGPCVSGNTAYGAGEIEVHGRYMEGGCTEPVGGH